MSGIGLGSKVSILSSIISLITACMILCSPYFENPLTLFVTSGVGVTVKVLAALIFARRQENPRVVREYVAKAGLKPSAISRIRRPEALGWRLPSKAIKPHKKAWILDGGTDNIILAPSIGPSSDIIITRDSMKHYFISCLPRFTSEASKCKAFSGYNQVYDDPKGI